ncbi:hypothetical protein chiPu_0032856, partial [Chiloscyllium punctatum]|nr:hypothetical protein [Chiloscyllium punctatum]
MAAVRFNPPQGRAGPSSGRPGVSAQARLPAVTPPPLLSARLCAGVAAGVFAAFSVRRRRCRRFVPRVLLCAGVVDGGPPRCCCAQAPLPSALPQ